MKFLYTYIIPQKVPFFGLQGQKNQKIYLRKISSQFQ